jgi:hypothetical protein
MARLPSLVLVHRVAIGSAVGLWITCLSAFFIPLQITIFLGVGLSLFLYIGASSKELRLRRRPRIPQMSPSEIMDEVLALAHTHRTDIGSMAKYRSPEQGVVPEVAEQLIHDG